MRITIVVGLVALAMCPAEAGQGIARKIRALAQPWVVATYDAATKMVTIRNVSSQPLLYEGYSPKGPLYAVQRSCRGKWYSTYKGWCGCGVQELTLEPGGAITFAVDPGRLTVDSVDPPAADLASDELLAAFMAEARQGCFRVRLCFTTIADGKGKVVWANTPPQKGP